MEITYEEFIQNILDTRGRFNCGDEYHERHHIIPRCMGGTNDKDNLIDLFAREHFEAHRLLALENSENEKLIYAWHMMAVVKDKNQDRYELSPEEYEEVKIACAKMQSETRSGKNHPNYGKHPSEETLEKQRIAHLKENLSDETLRKMSEAGKQRMANPKNNPMYGRTWWDENTPQEKIDEWKLHLSEVNSGENHPWFGKHHSEETKEKMRISHLKENLSPETLEKMKQSHSDMHGENNPMFGKRHSEESKELMRQKRIQWLTENEHPFKGRKHTEETKRKISEAKKGKKHGAKPPNSIKIIRLSDEKIYDSIKDTAKDNKMGKSTVVKYCKIHKDFMYYNEWLTKQNDLNNN